MALKPTNSNEPNSNSGSTSGSNQNDSVFNQNPEINESNETLAGRQVLDWDLPEPLSKIEHVVKSGSEEAPSPAKSAKRENEGSPAKVGESETGTASETKDGASPEKETAVVDSAESDLESDQTSEDEEDFPEDYPDYYASEMNEYLIEHEAVNILKQREDTRGRLAIIYTIATFVMFILGFVVAVLDAVWRQVSIAETLGAILPLISGIFLGTLGFVLGYYFRKSEDEER